jgi:hypothetical protein
VVSAQPIMVCSTGFFGPAYAHFSARYALMLNPFTTSMARVPTPPGPPFARGGKIRHPPRQLFAESGAGKEWHLPRQLSGEGSDGNEHPFCKDHICEERRSSRG